jgi:hypothetical protein
MAKCGLVDCDKKAVGGFVKSIPAGNFENPNATIPGMRTVWCKEHESMLNSGLYGGRYLKSTELD